jgi:hypothetical protein
VSIISKVVNYSVRNVGVINKEIMGMRKMPKHVSLGWQQGARLSKIQHSGLRKSMVNRGIGVYRRGVFPHIPGLFAGIGTILPLPGTSVGGFCLGKLFQKMIKNGFIIKK